MTPKSRPEKPGNPSIYKLPPDHPDVSDIDRIPGIVAVVVAPVSAEDSRDSSTPLGKFMHEHGLHWVGSGLIKDGRMYLPAVKWSWTKRGGWVGVSVWDCRATVVYRRGKEVYLDDVELPEDVREKMLELAEKSVYDAGGAINWSGLYPANEELVRLVEEYEEEFEKTLQQ